MEREIILDTETTGLDPKQGHRLVEIGCVELFNRVPTGKTFHTYLNPERDVPYDAERIHGIKTEFLQDKPKFSEIVDDFLKFVGNSKLVIHNADFDMKFINAELFYVKKSEIPKERVFCTLIYSRQKFPGAQNSLDALCRRFNVDNNHRDKHGALLDADLLAKVYLELMGGKQNAFELSEKREEKKQEQKIVELTDYKADFPFRTYPIRDRKSTT
ncbi:MAG TPA: DNA polymerase III subunit epsilon, partial [Alphaproteobacteria bacterium]|nr:DNA polymerase III subunit epsilon [Alphaproteobacteria bacterium]